MFRKFLSFFTLLSSGLAQKCFEKVDVVNSNNLFFYQNNVYDITGYDHPGGLKKLQQTIGQDLENYVTKSAYDFHLTSKSFKKDLSDIYVGILKDSCSTSPNAPPTTSPNTTLTTLPISSLGANNFENNTYLLLGAINFLFLLLIL